MRVTVAGRACAVVRATLEEILCTTADLDAGDESGAPEAPGPSGGARVSGVFDLKWKRRGPGRAPLLAHAAADGTATVYEAVRAGDGARALRTVASVRCADGEGGGAGEAAPASPQAKIRISERSRLSPA